MAHWFDLISIDPAVMNGQPCITGTRLTVRRVVEATALYPDRTQLKAEYPELTDEAIAQALGFAAPSANAQHPTPSPRTRGEGWDEGRAARRTA